MQTINYGIDLGTSNSAIAFARDGKSEIFPTDVGRSILPSAVMVEAGRLLVGEQAYARKWRPGAVATRFKRALGTNKTFTLKGIDKRYRPEELSAEILLELKRLAALRGHIVEQAVICTPAKFNAGQCEGTNEAARLAGISRPVLISEPMAASFGYGFTTERRGAWLIYDLGAGTFDAVVVRVIDGKLMPEIPEGENLLGGSDMDRIFWEEIIVPRLARELGISSDHPVFKKCHEEGLYQAEQVKVRLSQVEGATLNTTDFRSGFVVDGDEPEIILSLRRGELEAKLETLLDHSVAVCRQVLTRCPDVNEILLVGGPTIMPIVRAKLGELGLPINSSIDPMTAVATGAALYASTQSVPTSTATAKSPLAAAAGQRTSISPIVLLLDYEPTSEDEEAPVVVRCEDARAGWVEIDSASGNWTSGRVPATADGFVLTVPVLLRKANAFTVKTFSSAGALLPCEPINFSIFRGLTAGAPPLPESFFIEAENPDDDTLVISEVLIKRGTPLPARGKVRVRTKVELSRGSNASIIIKLWEGDRRQLRANRLAYSLTLTGDMLPRKLPANSEVEINVQVDSSRLIRAEAHIGLIDEVIALTKCDEKLDTNNPKQLEERRRQTGHRIEEVAQMATPEMQTSLDVCRNLLFNSSINSALKTAKAGGNEAGDACARVDEAIRAAEEELVGIRERQQPKLLPQEWAHELGRAGEVVRAMGVPERDQPRLERIEKAGQAALERKRWGELRRVISEVTRLRLSVLGRHPEFWHELADDLPRDPEVYAQPEEAARLLQRRPRHTDLGELRSDILRLIELLPIGTVGGEAEAATRIQLIG